MNPLPDKERARDLILDSDADVLVEGFGELDYAQKGRWRWALGNRQSVRFLAFSGHQRISFRVHLFRPETEVTIALESHEPITLSSSGFKEMLAGSLDFFRTEAEASTPVSVVFTISGKNESIPGLPDNFSFAIHSFRHSPVPSGIRDLSELPEKLLASGEAPPFFCSYPFVALFLNQEGKAFPCCYSESAASGLAGDAISTERITGKENITDAWNSTLLRSVRKEMLEGGRPSVCTHCIKLENSGSKSNRQEQNEQWEKEAVKLASGADRSGRMSGSPLILDIQQGNKCNLKCRMCGPANSVSLIEEHAEIVGGDMSRFRKNYWSKNAKIVRDLAEGANGICEFNMIGGEPFLTDEYLDLLHEFIRRGRSKNITLSLNSNLTVLSEKVREAFLQFRGVRLNVSLDGYGAVNEFIRHPSKFDTIERNLKTLYADPARWNLSNVSFNSTVQVYNVFELPPLFTYLERTFPRFHWFPHLSILTDPAEFSIQILPSGSRNEAIQILRSYLEGKASDQNLEGSTVTGELIQARVSSVIRHLEGKDASHLIPAFHRRHEIADRHRGHVIPYRIPGLI